MIFLSLMYLFIKQKLIKIDLRLDKQTHFKLAAIQTIFLWALQVYLLSLHHLNGERHNMCFDV